MHSSATVCSGAEQVFEKAVKILIAFVRSFQQMGSNLLNAGVPKVPFASLTFLRQLTSQRHCSDNTGPLGIERKCPWRTAGEFLPGPKIELELNNDSGYVTGNDAGEYIRYR
jgi:hypothetical protein